MHAALLIVERAELIHQEKIRVPIWDFRGHTNEDALMAGELLSSDMLITENDFFVVVTGQNGQRLVQYYDHEKDRVDPRRIPSNPAKLPDEIGRFEAVYELHVVLENDTVVKGVLACPPHAEVGVAGRVWSVLTLLYLSVPPDRPGRLGLQIHGADGARDCADCPAPSHPHRGQVPAGADRRRYEGHGWQGQAENDARGDLLRWRVGRDDAWPRM